VKKYKVKLREAYWISFIYEIEAENEEEAEQKALQGNCTITDREEEEVVDFVDPQIESIKEIK